MSAEERPGEEHGQDELIAAFAALGGRLTGDEFMRLVGSDEYYSGLVRLAALLLDGDTAAAEGVARDALAALQQARPGLDDPGKALFYLRQAVVNSTRSVRRRRIVDDRDTPQPAPTTPSAGHAATSAPAREPWVLALRTLPVRERETVVLHTYLGLSGRQAAQVLGISSGAASSHLARGMSSLRSPSGPGLSRRSGIVMASKVIQGRRGDWIPADPPW